MTIDTRTNGRAISRPVKRLLKVYLHNHQPPTLIVWGRKKEQDDET